MAEIVPCPKCGEPFGPYMWRGLVSVLEVLAGGQCGEQYMRSWEERHCDACGQTSIGVWRGWHNERPKEVAFTCLK